MKDIYQEVTDKIVAAMERAGKVGDRWAVNSGGMERPMNVRGTAYRGINVPILWAAAVDKGYTSPTWGTYKAWAERGAQVRKGERGTGIVFWTRVDSKDGDDEDAGYLMARGYKVFNAGQVDGYTDKFAPTPLTASAYPTIVRNPEIDAFIAATGATIEHHGVRAYYKLAPADKIVMPPLDLFRDAWSYYATLLHECVHWTADASRLNRDLNRRFQDAVAGEELTAEIGAAFLCADLGIADEPRDDHAAYVKSWLRALRNDKRAIFAAASAAQAACDYLHGLQPNASTADEEEVSSMEFAAA